MSISNKTRTRGVNDEFIPNFGRLQQHFNERPLAPVVPIAPVAKPIDPLSRDMIHFKGNYYEVKKLLAQRGPEITIEHHELNDDVEIAAKESRPLPTELVNADPIFAKYDGKYVILLGMQAVLNAVSEQRPIKGKLLSNPTLKNALAQ